MSLHNQFKLDNDSDDDRFWHFPPLFRVDVFTRHVRQTQHGAHLASRNNTSHTSGGFLSIVPRFLLVVLFFFFFSGYSKS